MTCKHYSRDNSCLFQLILCIFHLGFVTAFLSDAFISGYTTGTAVLVFTSQLSDIFGLTLKRYTGPFNIVYVIRRTILSLVISCVLSTL
jgi:MFS superfamily sulfate permease-like transporter